MSNLPPPTYSERVLLFSGPCRIIPAFHLGFQQDRSALVQVVVKEAPFIFDEDCKKAFEPLKKILISTPIIQPPSWGAPFEIMCDASDYVVGTVLGQSIDKLPHFIYYAS